MRIAAYIHPTRLGPCATGVGKHIESMCAELGARGGIDLTLLATAKDWSDYLRRDPSSPLADYSVRQISIRRAILEKMWSIGRGPAVERWVGNVDWAYCPMEAYVPTRTAKLAVTSHCMYWFDPALKQLYEKSRLERARWRIRLGPALKDKKVLFLAVSEFLKRELIRLFDIDEERIAVVGNGVEPAYFDAFARRDAQRIARPYLLAVGGLQYWKGADYLLRIARRLEELRSDFELVVVGRHEREFAAQAASYPNVRLRGYVGTRSGLPDLMAGATALLNLTRYDTFGIPVAEAMAAGAAVVASDNSALPEIMGSGGIAVEPEDTSSVCDVVLRLQADSGYRSNLIERGRLEVTRHTWNACCDRLLAAFSHADAAASIYDASVIAPNHAVAGLDWRGVPPEGARERALTASIVITTRNRKDELRQALASCLTQRGVLEVLVIDDGSSDGTAEMVRAEFPMVRLERREESKGLIVRRNEAARLARGDVIFSIDDDAAFSDERVVEQTLADFGDENIAAVAIPFANVNQSSEIKQRAPDDKGKWLANEYIGTAHAVRREVFNRLGGYREMLFHQGEEGDLCIRLLQAGYFVRLGRSAPIWHYESPRRNRQWMEIYGQRNLMLFAWYNVPTLQLPIYLVATILKGLLWGLRRQCLWLRCRGTMRGAGTIVQQWSQRRPVNGATFRLYRRLKKRGPLRAPRGATPGSATARRELVVAGRNGFPMSGLGHRVEGSSASRLESAPGIVSIVIVTHQRPQYLQACLTSCEKQVGVQCEFIVVINPADAESEEIAGRFGAKLIRTHRNLGFFPALNLGIVNSSGRLVMVIDDDARFEQVDAVARLQERLEEDPDCAVVTCNIKGPCEGAPYPSTREIHVFKTGFALFRREVFEDIAGYVPDLFFRAGGETYLSNYIYDRGYHVSVLHDVWMYHAQTATGRSQRAMNFYALRNHALIVLLQEPAVIVPVSLVAKLCSTALRIGFQRGDVIAWFTGWLSVCGNLAWALKNRKPISWASYRRLRRLRRMTGRAETPVVRQTADLSVERAPSRTN